MDNPTEVLQQLQQSGTYCDVKLMADGVEVCKAHAGILAAVSPVLRDSLREQPKGCYEVSINVDGNAMKNFVRFIYGEVLTTEEMSHNDLECLFMKLHVDSRLKPIGHILPKDASYTRKNEEIQNNVESFLEEMREHALFSDCQLKSLTTTMVPAHLYLISIDKINFASITDDNLDTEDVTLPTNHSDADLAIVLQNIYTTVASSFISTDDIAAFFKANTEEEEPTRDTPMVNGHDDNAASMTDNLPDSTVSEVQPPEKDNADEGLSLFDQAMNIPAPSLNKRRSDEGMKQNNVESAALLSGDDTVDDDISPMLEDEAAEESPAPEASMEESPPKAGSSPGKTEDGTTAINISDDDAPLSQQAGKKKGKRGKKGTSDEVSPKGRRGRPPRTEIDKSPGRKAKAGSGSNDANVPIDKSQKKAGCGHNTLAWDMHINCVGCRVKNQDCTGLKNQPCSLCEDWTDSMWTVLTQTIKKKYGGNWEQFLKEKYAGKSENDSVQKTPKSKKNNEATKVPTPTGIVRNIATKTKKGKGKKKIDLADDSSDDDMPVAKAGRKTKRRSSTSWAEEALQSVPTNYKPYIVLQDIQTKNQVSLFDQAVNTPLPKKRGRRSSIEDTSVDEILSPSAKRGRRSAVAESMPTPSKKDVKEKGKSKGRQSIQSPEPDAGRRTSRSHPKPESPPREIPDSRHRTSRGTSPVKASPAPQEPAPGGRRSTRGTGASVELQELPTKKTPKTAPVKKHSPSPEPMLVESSAPEITSPRGPGPSSGAPHKGVKVAVPKPPAPLIPLPPRSSSAGDSGSTELKKKIMSMFPGLMSAPLQGPCSVLGQAIGYGQPRDGADNHLPQSPAYESSLQTEILPFLEKLRQRSRITDMPFMTSTSPPVLDYNAEEYSSRDPTFGPHLSETISLNLADDDNVSTSPSAVDLEALQTLCLEALEVQSHIEWYTAALHAASSGGNMALVSEIIPHLSQAHTHLSCLLARLFTNHELARRDAQLCQLSLSAQLKNNLRHQPISNVVLIPQANLPSKSPAAKSRPRRI